MPWLRSHSESSCDNDYPDHDPNRCNRRDTGEPWPHWKCHRRAGHTGDCDCGENLDHDQLPAQPEAPTAPPPAPTPETATPVVLEVARIIALQTGAVPPDYVPTWHSWHANAARLVLKYLAQSDQSVRDARATAAKDREREEWRERAEKLESALNITDGQLTAARARAEKAERERDYYRDEHSKRYKEVNALGARVGELERKVLDAEREYMRADRERDDARAKLATAEEENAKADRLATSECLARCAAERDRDQYRAEMEEARAKLAEAKAESAKLRAEVDKAKRVNVVLDEENRTLKHQLAIVRVTEAEGVWHWQGHDDDLDSLVCPVVMSAERLRELLKSQPSQAPAATWLPALGVTVEIRDDARDPWYRAMVSAHGREVNGLCFYVSKSHDLRHGYYYEGDENCTWRRVPREGGQ